MAKKSKSNRGMVPHKGAAIQPLEGYAILNVNIADMVAAMQANYGGQASVQDLDQVSVPSGGGTIWQLPSIEGPVEVKEFEGVIVAHKWMRSYWAKPRGEGGDGPPDCFSIDMVTGRGTPGGACDGCQFNEWDSAPRGTGKACKERHMLFVFTPDIMLPWVVNVPPTSHGSKHGSRRYLGRLCTYGLSHYQITTKFSLRSESGPAGNVSKITFAAGERIPDDQASRFKELGDRIKALIEAQPAAYVNEPEDDHAGE